MQDLRSFTKHLLAWFDDYGRHDLPWRKNYDPYSVWIAEIMLQQTQVPRVEKDFYPRFLKAFPTIQDLAKAQWEEVYPVWEGLGYYRRGRNMLKAAQIIVDDYQGKFPQTIAELEALPGIGHYTACAIAAFAFDQKVAAIDTNISKIISVLWPSHKEASIAQKLVEYSPSGRTWNSAMMDLASALRAKEKIEGDLGTFFPSHIAPLFLPKKKKSSPRKTTQKKSRKHRIEVGVACIHRDGKYLLQTRPEGKTFEGEWEFPGGKREKGENFRTCIKREIKEEIGIEVSVRPAFFKELHHFEKVDLLLSFHRCQIQKGEPKPLEQQRLQWVAPQEFDKVSFLKTNAKALEKLKSMKF